MPLRGSVPLGPVRMEELMSTEVSATEMLRLEGLCRHRAPLAWRRCVCPACVDWRGQHGEQGLNSSMPVSARMCLLGQDRCMTHLGNFREHFREAYLWES